ncbi:hypothetical protein FHU10_1379 [Serratia fonticola]|uniref:Uncharacterized protein n=1 Tax=Serratia fonticola TaxID=47917 RepID=A0A542D8I2_SERFO|nr:hypothetical protein [Serratia fonticola]TQI78585.1 hypothetical protein FHU09_1071 [Serratia fonticola]TQI99392.1 hypothetical protein FHU11_4980 [Serratia fonticola]TVZ68917.1 hypothetical protein FHU10_1379 [Serratia fonticola]
MAATWYEVRIKCHHWQPDPKANRRQTTHHMEAEVIQSMQPHYLPWATGSKVEIRVNMQLDSEVASAFTPGAVIRLAVADNQSFRVERKKTILPYLVLRGEPRMSTPNPCEIWADRHSTLSSAGVAGQESIPQTVDPITAMNEIIERLGVLARQEYSGRATHIHVLEHCQKWLKRNIDNRQAKETESTG